MKVIVSMLTAALLAASPALAQEVFAETSATPEVQFNDVYEIDEGAMSLFDLQAVQNGEDLFSLDPARKNDVQMYANGSDIIGVIIGGIIGAIAANVLEKDHKYKNRTVTCFAKNKRGHVFRAQGKRPRAVQARAMDKCYRDSNRCRQLGCRV